jgi:outer membrane protein assembly factor BamE (lipoprotein component of BamABCDE complex)
MKNQFLGSLILCSCLSSCIIDTSSRTERSGRQVGHETLEQIQPGRTREFVLALLGEPTSRSGAGGKSEVWKWEYRSREQRSGSLIFVFDSDKTTEVRNTTYVLFEDGQAVKAWQD